MNTQIVTVAFDSSDYEQPSAYTKALDEANTFLADYSIQREQIISTQANAYTYTFDNMVFAKYAVTYVLEVPVRVAEKIRADRKPRVAAGPAWLHAPATDAVPF